MVFLLVGAAMFAMFLFLTYYFQINLGYTPLRAGFAFLPFSLGIILSAGFVSQLLPRIGPRPLMIPGLAMAATGMLLLTRIDQHTSYWAVVFPAMVVMSIGLAGVFIPAASTSLIGVRSHDAGVASAVLNTSQQVGGSLGAALLNTLFAGAVTGYFADHPARGHDAMADSLPLAFLRGYHAAFYWGAGLFVAALAVAIFLMNAHRGDAHPEGAEPGPGA